MSYAAIAANSMSSLKSLSFKLRFGLIPDTAINLSSRKALCIIVLIEVIEKGFPIFAAYALARLIDVREALKLKSNLSRFQSISLFIKLLLLFYRSIVFTFALFNNYMIS